MAIDSDILEAAGVPFGALRRPAAWPGSARVRSALEGVSAAALPEEFEDALLAWLSGFQHHWPEEFKATTGELGAELIDRLERHSRDWNRYLKLRRIAIENLTARSYVAR